MVQPKKNNKLKIVLYLSALPLTLVAVFILFVFAVNKGVFGYLPTAGELKMIRNETASLVYSEDGKLIGKYFAENRTNITYNQLPKTLLNALVAVEDVRYFKHKGIDSRSLLRVFFRTLLFRDKRAGGGSTITQQLAKNLYGRKTYGVLTVPVNKVKEAILAARLEKIYSKEEILTLYLNTVPFGENVFGIEAAAGRYFNKSVSKLKVEESAVLVGMLKANTFYNPRLHPDNALMRRNVVLMQMEKYGYLTKPRADSLQLLPLKLDYSNIETEGPANYFLVQVKEETKRILDSVYDATGKVYDIHKDGLIISTTLNHQMQLMALESLKKHLSKLQPLLRSQYRKGVANKFVRQLATTYLKRMGLTLKTDSVKVRELFDWSGYRTDSISSLDSIVYSLKLLHAGLVALDPANGAVKIYVGGIDFRTQPYDQVMAKRQLASTFKPILYAAALETGLSPCTYLDNDSIVFPEYDDWNPKNYDNTFGGKYSMQAALAKSMNVPSVHLFMQCGFEQLDYVWRKLGFSSELQNSPATALGTGNANVMELAVAFAAFANGGYKVEPYLIQSIKTADGVTIYKRPKTSMKTRVISERTAMLMTHMLSKAINEGTGTALRTKYGLTQPLAGKTGTSQDYSDAWFGVYTPRLVIATRVGASVPSIHFHSGQLGSGSALALPLAGYTLVGLQQKNVTGVNVFRPFPTPSDLLLAETECDDFMEDSFKDKLKDFLTPDHRADSRKQSKHNSPPKKKEKESLFRRIFGKKK